MAGLGEEENSLFLCKTSSGCSALCLSAGQVSQCPQDDRVKLLPFSPHAELNSRAGWESEGVRSVPIRCTWLAWDTSHFCHFWPENLPRSDSAVF